jgi:3-hydroxymyristoyl/3-hydroxydecanoyl-(acyl carrier protein) dehydratase
MGDAETFVLHGRSADLVNVAGKRTSLAYLNHHLNGIEGVRDGIFFMPNESSDGVTRLTAFVVAPELTREALLGALRLCIDAAFLPRPLYFVDALPRNATGKLPRETLLRFAQTCERNAGRSVTTVHRLLAPDHPAAQGHFPGNPIIPGAVLLDEIIDAIEQSQPSDSGYMVKSAKFLHLVRPGEALLIRLDTREQGEVRFECLVDDRVAVSGSLRPAAAQREGAA